MKHKSLSDIAGSYDRHALYDLTKLIENYRCPETCESIPRSDLNAPYEWRYFFSLLFPDEQYTALWIGRLGSDDWRLIQFPMQRINSDEGGFAYTLYGPPDLAVCQNGEIKKGMRLSYRGGPNRLRNLLRVDQADWVKAVFDAENTEIGEIAELKYLPASFEEMHLLDARPFTREESCIFHGHSEIVASAGKVSSSIKGASIA